MKLTIENAKTFALKKFKELPELLYQWNIYHTKGIIKALSILGKTNERLTALAWVHDIGKTISDKDHAVHSVEILEKEFELDNIDKDCILNHGSKSKPLTSEGKTFRYCDGLSLFMPEVINFRFYIETKEGLSFEEIQEKIKKTYYKYNEAYSDNDKVINVLSSNFNQ